jgi:L-2-hydroxyglutarate oxidase LhgO
VNEIDIAVIGGGVVGLACALALAESGASVCVVERESRPGRGMSTHNSGVIHAGIYYPPGSLKARLCLEGRDRLLRLLRAALRPASALREAPVASHENEIAELEVLRRGASRTARPRSRWSTRISCGGRSLMCARPPRSGRRIRASSKPKRSSPRWGGLCRDLDVAMVVGTPIVDAAPANGGVELVTPHERFGAKTVVNAAGLHADEVSAMLGARRFHIKPCRASTPSSPRRSAAG